jgi:phenylacetate-CoA ligase
MDKHFLKSFKDKMPESLKYVTGHLFRNKLINNKDFLNYSRLLEDRELLTASDIMDYQLNSLKEILVHSYYNVPYYTGLFNKIGFDPFNFSDFKEIEVIPLLTREIITENFSKLISTKKVKNGYYTASTGGSSGLPLKFLLDYDSLYKENAFIYHYRKKLGYELSDKIITFRNIIIGEKFYKYNPMHSEVVFSNTKLSKITINQYVDKIIQIKPQYLNGYLSAIWYFAKLLKENNLNLNFKLKGVFMISENIDMEQRKFVEQFFNVKSMTFYGHSERCIIAEEKLPCKYVFDPYYGYTEQVLTEEGENVVVGTGFLNRNMPLIRYLTDDICFRDGDYFEIDGKRSSSIGLIGKNNEFLPVTGFRLSTRDFKNVITYQFIQDIQGKADLYLIVNKDFQDKEMVIIKKYIEKQTSGIIDIEIKIVDHLLLTPRGKYQKCISRIAE